MQNINKTLKIVWVGALPELIKEGFFVTGALWKGIHLDVKGQEIFKTLLLNG